MPARSKSQQRLFGMLHAYNKGELQGSKALKKRMSEMSKHISDEDARHFAETPHKGLPEKKAKMNKPIPKKLKDDENDRLKYLAFSEVALQALGQLTGKQEKKSEDYSIESYRGKNLSNNDLSKLVELFRQLDDEERSYDKIYGYRNLKHDLNKKWIKQWIKRKSSGYLAKDVEGNIIGYGTNEHSPGEISGFVSNLIVDKDHRGSGIGKSILKRIIADNIKQDRDTMLRVSLNNPAGLHLYSNLGFIPTSQTMLYKGELEKKASRQPYDIAKIYEDVRRAYGDLGYSVSGDRLKISNQPTYSNGKPVPSEIMHSNESGGNVQDDGTVVINPEYRKVMRHWKLKGSGLDFLRTIIGHELGHHVDRTLLRTDPKEIDRNKLLDTIRRRKFHTIYTDSYGLNTDPRKLDKELIAEYLAQKVVETIKNRK